MKKYLILILLLFPFFVSASPNLIKGNGDRVYVKENNQRRWIPTAEIFESYGFEWSDIKITDINIPDNNLVKLANDDKVYFLDTQLHWIPTAEVFEKKGFKWADIQIINQKEFDFYKLGYDISLQKYSDTIANVLFTAIIQDGSCLLSSPCPPSPDSLALTNNAILATLSFDINPLGFENAKLSKVVIKQVGYFSPEDYEDVQLVADKRYYGVMIGDTITFIFDPVELKGNQTTSFYLTADLTALASGKFYQFRFVSADIVGELSNLPVRYNSDILTSAVSINTLHY